MADRLQPFLSVSGQPQHFFRIAIILETVKLGIDRKGRIKHQVIVIPRHPDQSELLQMRVCELGIKQRKTARFQPRNQMYQSHL